MVKYIIIFLLSVCLAYLLCKPEDRIVVEKIIEKIDTIVTLKVDTLVKFKPVAYKETVRDTIFVHDTVLVYKTKLYQDSTYKVQISGINPNLDFIEVYPRTVTQYINRVEKVYLKPKKWGIGPQVGYGIGPNGLQPYIGIGVQYNVFQF